MNVPDSQPPIARDSLPGTGLVDPFAGERVLAISAPPPEAGPDGGAIPWVYRSQLDAPMRVRIPLPIALAIAFHVALFAAAFIIPKLGESRPPLQMLKVQMIVQKGKPRDPRLMPRKDVPPPPPPASTGAAPQPTPAPVKPIAPAAQPKPAPPHARQLSRQEQMEQALAQATKNVDQQEHKVKPEEREGSESGSVNGNSSNEEDGDKYFTAVQAAIVANYSLPSIISEKERMSLTATVDIWIARDGTISRHQFEHHSGNQFFDDALEVAIKRTRCPPPPADRAASIAKDGVALVFTP